MLSIFDLLAILLTLSAVLGWINHRYLPTSHSVGVLVMSVLVSVILVMLGVVFPGQHIYDSLTDALKQIDFTDVVMNGMLAFLLFAGALHVDLGRLRDRAVPVLVLATFGTTVSTGIVGIIVWLAGSLLGIPLTLLWALVFGALISPTDPVAVLSTLKGLKIPANLEVEMQGESLFNDGIGIVLFTVLLVFATEGGGGDSVAPSAIAELLIREAAGGIVLGIATGYLPGRNADHPRSGDRNIRHCATAACKRGTRGGRRRSVDRRPGTARCDERSHADLCLRSVDSDRRNPQFRPIPVDRA